MASYMKFKLEDGSFAYIEVAEGPKSSGGLIPASKGENASGQNAVSFDEAFDTVKKLASAMVQKLRDGSESEPDEVNISFGLKAASELNSLIVSRGGMDTNFGISVRWRSSQKDEADHKAKEEKKEEEKE